MGKSLLFLVTGLTLTAGLMQFYNNKRIQALPKATAVYYEEQQARNIAESLIDNAIRNLIIDNTWKGDISSLGDIMDVGTMVYRSNTELKTRVENLAPGYAKYLGTLNQNNNNSNLNISGELYSYDWNDTLPPNLISGITSLGEFELLLIGTATFENTTISTEVLMQRDSYTKFSYFSRTETTSGGNHIRWNTGDEVHGPIHTNTRFGIVGRPTFHGYATAIDPHSSYGNYNDPDFAGGTDFNAQERPLPEQSEMDRIVDLANSGDLAQFTEDIEVEYYLDSNDNGFVRIKKESDSTWTHNIEMQNFDGIISTTGKAKMRGVVNGQSTLHAVGDITIDGDIVYKTSPLDDSLSTDQLGIVGESDIIVDNYAHQANGDSDITISASIMAMNGSFKASGIQPIEPYGYRGRLNLIGGMYQNVRGAIAASGELGNVTVGFTANYQYDPRFLTSAPPGFPRETQFSIRYWTEKVER